MSLHLLNPNLEYYIEASCIGKPEGNFFGSYELIRAQKVDKIEKKEQKVPKSTSNLHFAESRFQALQKKLKKL
jgi:hypothetical protein